MKSAVMVGEEGLLSLCGEHLLERNWRIAAIVTHSMDIGAWAAKNQISVVTSFAQLMAEPAEPPDYLFSVTNFSIVPREVISWVRAGSFNFHDGPLPAVGGLNTPSWAILTGASSHGISWHQLTTEVDAGGVIVSREFAIEPQDSVLELNARCFEHGYEGFQELVQAIEGDKIQALPARSPLRYFPRAQKPDYIGFIDWSNSAQSINNLFRATAYAGYRNGLTTTKILLPDGCVTPEVLQVSAHAGENKPPGTVLQKTLNTWLIQTGDGVVEAGGSELQGSSAHLVPGICLPDIKTRFPRQFVRTEQGHVYDDMAWVSRLKERELSPLQYLPVQTGTATFMALDLPLASEQVRNEAEALAATALLLGRMNGTDSVSVAASNDRLREMATALPGFFLGSCPVFLDIESTGEQLIESSRTALLSLDTCPPLSTELFSRIPGLASLRDSYRMPNFVFASVADAEALATQLQAMAHYTLAFVRNSNRLHLISNSGQAIADNIDRLLCTTLLLLHNGMHLGVQSLAGQRDTAILESVNSSTRFTYAPTTIDALVRERAAGNSQAIALYWKGESCTWDRLMAEADRVSAYLLEQGFAANSLIGVMLVNKIESVYTMLGVLQAGFAYVPLDPAYPSDRLRYIASDAALACIVADPVAAQEHALLDLCVSPAELGRGSLKATASHTPSGRAYVIYTSGSTGKPKGVQVSHDNVVNFMHGMDRVITGHAESASQSGTMLSVTSISFDISVLEIWWSLSRGLKVVFYDPEHTIVDSPAAGQSNDQLRFSLYFWNTQDPAAPSTVGETYDLLKQAALFADQHGFEAIWSPERHFGSFGGPFPNPAITGAALATITTRVKIRAGSCVMPLHHPIRVAEDWSMIDNLSGGRVGISFASGWMPMDFALAPQNYVRAKEIMFEGIQQVRALWRGEAVTFPGPKGDLSIQTLPRPIQKELPSWITTAGSPDTFIQAGEQGFNVLTHLLGQSASELATKIKLYREAWNKAGHPGTGCVTLMLHTFITESKDYAREVSRGPMKAYLKSAMNLVKAAAWEFPTFKKLQAGAKQDMDEFFNNLTEEDIDDLLEFAFQRYFNESGLFGSPEENLPMLEVLRSYGVNEIGCLIDFGIRPAEVLANLQHLNTLRSLSSHRPSNNLNEIVDHFSITHMQCTPSQANMFSLESADLAGMGKLQYLLVGGEALSRNLADKLTHAITGKLINMYGPTETTVWSLTREIHRNQPVQIGLPIANTTVHVLDHRQRPVPTGWPGELYIGGKGVSLGYLNRPDLNSARFVSLAGEALYATGDMVRMCEDGNVEYLGRNDHQVKVRGYRIELGEVESALERMSGIDEAVVIDEKDQWGETQLSGYFTSKSAMDLQYIRTQLGRVLPVFMVPSRLQRIGAIPRTLNGKVDRKALKGVVPQKAVTPGKPAPNSAPLAGAANSVIQKELLEIWQALLDTEDIDLNANFFDIGGHSILAVRLQGILSKKYERRVPISELFRFPTINKLAGYLHSSATGSKPVTSEFEKGAVSRAAKRKARYQKS